MSQGKFEDLTGQTFGYLNVLFRAEDYVQPSGQHKRMWHCKCACGNECNVRANDLKSGNTTSCGCMSSRKASIGIQDLTGNQYGDFVVIERAPNRITPGGQQTRQWKCKCVKCGIERIIAGSQIKSFSGKCECTIEAERQQKEIKKIEEKEEKERIRKSKQELAVLIKGRKNRKNIVKDESLRATKEAINDEIELRKKEFIGREFGLLSVQSFSGFKNKELYWNCVCKCGREKVESEKRLLEKKAISCGCVPSFVGKSLQEKNPKLSAEWHPTKNGILTPDLIGVNSSKRVWWICSKGHSYDSPVRSRNSLSTGCPYCSNPPKKIWKGFNDLQTTNPSIASEWHPTKNGKLTASDVFRGSARSVWWKPKCGHEFEMKIAAKKENSCPYCSHQRLLKGFSDFETTNPELLDEWDYKKNDVLPSEIGVGTHKKIWWKCPFGHSYQAYPSNRVGNNHSGCPICDKENHTSFPEQALFYYIKQYYPDALNSDRNAIGMELDIYIPSLKIAIEYDGHTWHKNNAFEIKKNNACNKHGILLMRIREEGLDTYDDCYCIIRKDVRSNDSLSSVIRQVLLDIDYINNIDVDVDRDSGAIYSSYISTRKAQSLKNTYPELARDWHPTKNGTLTAEMVAPMTNKSVWWLGKCGHEWLMSVQDRTNQNCGCPICSGKRIVSGINDLLTKYPEICEEWLYEKNSIEGLFPDKIAPHSDKKAWWKCRKCGYIWQTKIDGRTRMKSGCPECGKRIISAAKFKPVRCIETGVEYLCLKEAEESTGINGACISNCCRGKQKTAGKHHWEFIDSVEKE